MSYPFAGITVLDLTQIYNGRTPRSCWPRLARK
jgi:hypothetical protein